MKHPTRPLAALLALSMLSLCAADAASQGVSDAQIEDAVMNSQVFKEDLKGDIIVVESRDGAVTLTGTVGEEHHKNLANAVASAQKGVWSVESRLSTAEDSLEPGSDGWLRAKVRTLLGLHRSVSAAYTQVVAHDGIITLRGSADSQAQKDLTSQYAMDVEGVRAVYNEISVSRKSPRGVELPSKVDDASISARVRLALQLHLSSSALDTGVTTLDGVVTLTGSADSRAEAEQAGAVVADVKDVKAVRNAVRFEGK